VKLQTNEQLYALFSLPKLPLSNGSDKVLGAQKKYQKSYFPTGHAKELHTKHFLSFSFSQAIKLIFCLTIHRMLYFINQSDCCLVFVKHDLKESVEVQG